MKVCFQPGYWWDYSAPTLTAELIYIDGFIQRYRVYCQHCEKWHHHGSGIGHREAHCTNSDSPYHKTGYNIQCEE